MDQIIKSKYDKIAFLNNKRIKKKCTKCNQEIMLLVSDIENFGLSNEKIKWVAFEFAQVKKPITTFGQKLEEYPTTRHNRLCLGEPNYQFKFKPGDLVLIQYKDYIHKIIKITGNREINKQSNLYEYKTVKNFKTPSIESRDQSRVLSYPVKFIDNIGILLDNTGYLLYG